MADYYFAYGSNLNRRQFFHRCPEARGQGRMTLPDFELVFRGVADIVDAPGKKVEGAMYRITPRCEKALDRYEGFPRLYRKRSVAAQIGKGRAAKVVEVMFYVMNDSYLAPPSDYYLQTIEDGFHDWKIPTKTLDLAVLRAYRPAAVEFANDPQPYGKRQSIIRRRGAHLPRFVGHGEGLDETRHFKIV